MAKMSLLTKRMILFVDMICSFLKIWIMSTYTWCHGIDYLTDSEHNEKCMSSSNIVVVFLFCFNRSHTSAIISMASPN